MKRRVVEIAVAGALGLACMMTASQSRASGDTAATTGQREHPANAGAQPGESSAPTGSSESTAASPGTSEPSGGTGSSAMGGSSAAQPSAPHDPMMRPGPAIKGHSEDQVVSGRVASIAADALEIQNERGDSRLLEIVPQTSIKLDGKDATYSELKEGQPVRASFNRVDGSDVAVEIEAGAFAQRGSSLPSTGTSRPEGGQVSPPPSPTDQGLPLPPPKEPGSSLPSR